MRAWVMFWLLGLLPLGTAMAQTQWPREWVKTSCVLAWTAPTTKDDASPLTDLDHYRVCVSTTTGGACTVADVTNILAGTTQTTCGALNMTISPNPYFVRVYAVNTTGGESVASNEKRVTVTDGRTLIRQ